MAWGTPQGSPLSPVLYMLYLAELLLQDTELRFGYADDVALYRASPSLDENIDALKQDVTNILSYDLRTVSRSPQRNSR